MAKVYYDLVIKGKITIDKVPSRWRAAVQKMLDENEQERG